MVKAFILDVVKGPIFPMKNVQRKVTLAYYYSLVF